MELTDAQLDQIEARADAATAGTWWWQAYRDGGQALVVPQGRFHDVNILKTTDDWPPAANDAEFIAHAREDVHALIAEVRRLRAEADKLTGLYEAALTDRNMHRLLIAEADRHHRPCEWHLYATPDCTNDECDPDDEDHDSGCCITATYKVCAECVDNWREGMGDWLDVTEDVPPDDTLWPCPTHTALHPEEDQ